MKLHAVLLSTALCGAIAFGQTPPEPTFEFKTEKVAFGVYSFIVPETHANIVQGNSTVVIGSDGALVIDTGQFPSVTRRHIAEIRKITNQPVKFVLFTHWHGDHNFCGAVYKDEFPGVTIISTGFTRQLMATEGPAYLKAAAENWPVMVDRLPKVLASGKRRDGTALSDVQKSIYQDDLTVLQVAIPEFKSVTTTLADLTFDRDLTLYLGDREVQIKWLGRANTAGDAITWIPDAKVLITGDTVVWPTPYGYGSYYSEWPAILRKMISMNAAAIVPGHGPVMHDHRYLERLIPLFESVSKQVKELADASISLEDTYKKIDLSRFRDQFAGNDPFRRHAFDEYFVQPAVSRAYQEAKGKMNPESLVE